MLTYEKNLTTGITREYAYLNNQIIGWKETDSTGNSVKRYAVTDLLGSVTTVTDESGTVMWSGEYTAFGNVAYGSGDVLYDGMYTGKDIDSETGLTYHWNRWRSEDGSSFISEDPARDGSNWYGYCGNNPINSTDPTGLVMDYANGGSGTYWGAKEDRPVNDSRVTPDEGPEQGPTEPQKPEIKQPTIYYDNYGNPTNDPHDFTGKQQGDSPLSAKQIFDYIVSIITNAGLMGKEYVDSGSPTYVCSDFLRDTVNLLKLSIEKYLPGGQLVSNSIKLFDKKDYILPSAGSNPASGVYVFYKIYDDDYQGHTGLVYFDDNSKAHVLHNGAVKGSSKQGVNIFDSESVNFNDFFIDDKKNSVIYKEITMNELFPLW